MGDINALVYVFDYWEKLDNNARASALNELAEHDDLHLALSHDLLNIVSISLGNAEGAEEVINAAYKYIEAVARAEVIDQSILMAGVKKVAGSNSYIADKLQDIFLEMQQEHADELAYGFDM